MIACRRILSLVIFFLLLVGCKKEISNERNIPEILLPRDGSLIITGESIRILVEVNPDPGFRLMEIFLDDAPIHETADESVDIFASSLSLTQGIHILKVLAYDAAGGAEESSVSFQLEELQTESGDTTSFGALPASGWTFSAWNPNTSSANDDQFSIFSASDNAVALTRKTFEEAGSISFYIKEGSGVLEFRVDGKLKAKWFWKDDWGRYAYSVPAGRHVFRWESKAEGTFMDHVVFSPGLEQHTPGEIYGGGTIFYLDATGLHGLIAAPEDGTYKGRPEIPWGCHGLKITSGTKARSYEDGQGNTWAIQKDCKLENIAARYCYDYISNEDSSVWDDWYLPALYELRKLYNNRAVLDGLGGQYYWSSTSFSTNAASVIDFSDGGHHGAHRNIPNVSGPVEAGIHVRPIRKF